jgi:uncharacterized protein
MALLQPGAEGGFFRRLYWPDNPAGLWVSIGLAFGLLVLHQVLQFGFAAVAVVTLFDGDFGNMREMVKSTLVGIFPASLGVAALAWWFAGRGGGDPAAVLSLRRPPLTGLGWLVLVVGFMVFMYAAIVAVVLVLGLDLSQYTPGQHGESPDSGSAGLVKEAMFDIANTPWLFALAFPSVALGAPIAEELIFRGQLFAALSRSWLGVSGTIVVTSALWALMHMSEPWLSVGMIFIMGLAFGWMLYRFGSLWLTIACHAAWNAFYSLVIFLTIGSSS